MFGTEGTDRKLVIAATFVLLQERLDIRTIIHSNTEQSADCLHLSSFPDYVQMWYFCVFVSSLGLEDLNLVAISQVLPVKAIGCSTG